MDQNDTINKWGVVQLYSSALKKSAWIEAISLGYTLLEMQLRFLVKSKAGRSTQPLDDATVEKCEYLMQVAALARDEGFFPQVLFEKVKALNAARIRALHKLLTETVTMSELQSAASLASPFSKEIQDLWLKKSFGAEQRVGETDA
jgi:hypothetical protein